MFRLAAIEAALASLFPPSVVVAVEPIVREHGLWDEELVSVSGAVPARRMEFAAGRTAARRCLAGLGREPTALPVGADRAAVWPTGVFGSISHAAGIALAVAGETGPLGVDVEPDTALEADLWPVICGERELVNQSRTEPGRWVKQMFVAKEAVFKAQHPIHRTMFGFDAVEIALIDGEFAATYQQYRGTFAKGDKVRGKIVFVQGLIIGGVSI